MARGLAAGDVALDDVRNGEVGRGRITVREACLACHGAKAERPDFVKERYPEDRACGFEVGDLRGLYSVFVPADAGERETAEPGDPEPERDR